jgi:hypothetical protein
MGQSSSRHHSSDSRLQTPWALMILRAQSNMCAYKDEALVTTVLIGGCISCPAAAVLCEFRTWHIPASTPSFRHPVSPSFF